MPLDSKQQRSGTTEYPVLKSTAGYAASCMQTKGKTAKYITYVCGNTFFRLRRKLEHNVQFINSLLNCGDVLFEQTNQTHRSPAACKFDGMRQLFRAVLFSTPHDVYRRHGGDMHHEQGCPCLSYTDGHSSYEEVQKHFD